MKKIRNIQDLEDEKLKLRVKQLELEKKLDRSWRDLQKDFTRNSDIPQKPDVTSFNFKTGSGILNGALNFGVGFLSHKLGTVAGRTFEDAAEKIFGKMSQKINSLVSKRKNSQ